MQASECKSQTLAMRESFKNVTLRLENYKCFPADEAGYDELRSVNVMVGRNNSGKSALLDLVELACSPSLQIPESLGHFGRQPKVVMTNEVDETTLRRAFSDRVSGGPIPGNHWEYGRSAGLQPRGQGLESQKKAIRPDE